MEFRNMRGEDIETVFCLGKEKFGSDAEYSWDWSMESVRLYLDDSFGFGVICSEGNDIIGFALVKTCYASQKPDVAWLNYIFIDGRYRRKNFGSELLDFITSNLRELGKRELIADIYAHNKASLDFFKQCGFELKEKWLSLSKKL